MAGDWSITLGAVTVTLPRNPSRATLKYPAWFKEYGAGSSIIVSLGTKATVLTIEGLFAKAGKTMADLETDYVNKLADMVYKEVTIAAPNAKYDGDWIFTIFSVEERGGVVRGLWYKMEFVKGAIHKVG